MKKSISPKPLKQKSLYFIDEEGEIQDLGPVEITAKKENLNSSFLMLFNTIMDQPTGILEFDFLFYLIKRMTNKNTIITFGDKRMAKDLSVCRQTIETIKKKLRDLCWLKYRAECIMINPRLFFKGNAYKRSQCICDFDHFEGIGDLKPGTENPG